ncbi:MAG: cytochrome c peroxidase [Bacteroidota bacterium]
MTRVFAISFFCFTLVFLSSCRQDPYLNSSLNPLDIELDDLLSMEAGGLGKSAYRLPPSNLYQKIPQDPKNSLTSAKIHLGQQLYHETGMAINAKHANGMYTYSCASCHHAAAGFQAGRQQGIGDGGVGFGFNGENRFVSPYYDADSIDVQPIRTPSALNIAYQTNVLWNGQFGATGVNVGTESKWTEGTPLAVNKLGYEGTEIQAIAGITVHRMEVTDDLIDGKHYREYFDQAFPNVPESERYTNEYAGLAIAAYERTLLANQAPFQKWLIGDREAMTDGQKRGAVLFFGQAGCSSCHTGPALNSMEFYALGMDNLKGSGIYGGQDDNANLGRGGFTKNPEDNHKFKVPQLYNLKDSPFLGHGGTFLSVREVIEYKNKAIPSYAEVLNSELPEEFSPLNLRNDEIEDLVDFVENALYDPDLERYVPSRLSSGFCFPNNDSVSKNDLGCQ